MFLTKNVTEARRVNKDERVTIDITGDPANLFQGIPTSSGVVIGKAYLLDRHMICVLERKIQPGEVSDEIDRFRSITEAAQNEMH